MTGTPRFTVEQMEKISAKISSKLMGHPVLPETRAKISAANMGKNKGKPKPEGFGAKISAAEKGRPKSEVAKEKDRAGHLGKRATDETKAKMSILHTGKKHTEEWKRNASKGMSGEKHWNWKGGITPMNVIIRKGLDYSLWRTSVYERDEYACQKCGKVGGILKAHHLNSFADFPEQRLDIENGITFCEDCHREFHRRYGVRHNRKWQTVEFLLEESKA
jgi:hypothetical protein